MTDFQAYLDGQARVSQAYQDREHWTRMSILNVACTGKFSSDRTIREYCQDVWQIKPIKVALLAQDEVIGELS